MVALCLFGSASSLLAARAEFTAFIMFAAPPPKAPRALNPANIGMSDKTPPVFGIGTTRVFVARDDDDDDDIGCLILFL